MDAMYKSKAQRTIRAHSKWWQSERGKRWIGERGERWLHDTFNEQYNCYPDVLARAFEQAHRNGFCPVCSRPYKDLRDITLDIWINDWSIMCRGCNSRRATKTPEKWAIYQQQHFKSQTEFDWKP